MEKKTLRNIINLASKGNAARVKEAVYGLLDRKLGLALNAKQSELSKTMFAGAKDAKKSE